MEIVPQLLIGVIEMNALMRDLPNLFDSLFFSWPTEPKPPIESFPIVDSESAEGGQVKGWEIQMAVAGFKEKDIEVWSEGKVLHIKGSNKENNVANRFTCSFNHRIPCSKHLDLESAAVKLEDGILSIQIPMEEERVEQRRYLFKK